MRVTSSLVSPGSRRARAFPLFRTWDSASTLSCHHAGRRRSGARVRCPRPSSTPSSVPTIAGRTSKAQIVKMPSAHGEGRAGGGVHEEHEEQRASPEDDEARMGIGRERYRFTASTANVYSRRTKATSKTIPPPASKYMYRCGDPARSERDGTPEAREAVGSLEEELRAGLPKPTPMSGCSRTCSRTACVRLNPPADVIVGLGRSRTYGRTSNATRSRRARAPVPIAASATNGRAIGSAR